MLISHFHAQPGKFLARVLMPLMLLAVLLGLGRTALAADEFLDPALAFRFSAKMADPHTVAVTYEIADGYYMYREHFKFAAKDAKLGKPDFPPAQVKFDETFNKNVETYHHAVTVKIPVEAAGMFTLIVTGQGCAEKGLCYAPQESQIQLMGGSGAAQSNAPGAGGMAAQYSAPAGAAPGFVNAPAAQAPVDVPATSAPVNLSPASPAAPAPASELSGIASVLGGGSLLAIIPAFLLLGLGLAFTPCVLPMVPILSSIIVGEGQHVARSRGLILSIAYSLGMAIVYTCLGVAAGLLGEGLAAALQNPWVLGAFGLLIVAMALSMFGLYELQLPSSLQTRLSGVSGRQSAGKLAGVFVMGAVSALIVGPCVAAPLAGALVYISQTRNVFIGGSALFSMAMGMSIPLLLVGVSAGSLLPRAGAWMNTVKTFFGVLMLGMAIWLVSPVLPPLVQMLLWSALGLAYGTYLLRSSRHWGAIALGVGCAALGAVQLVGVATGGRDALAPLAHLGAPKAPSLQFARIKSVNQLDAALAKTGGKTVILDFYADWCVSCKEMEKLTFVHPQVKQALASTILLQVDVTANDADDKAMLQRFHLFGPPGIILFDGAGKEIADSRVIGYQAPDKFLTSLTRLR